MHWKALGEPKSGSAPPSTRTYRAGVSEHWTGPSLVRNGTCLDDLVLHLEDGSGERALPLVVQPVRVRAVLDQQLDEVSVAIVGRQHELPVTRTPHNGQ